MQQEQTSETPQPTAAQTQSSSRILFIVVLKLNHIQTLSSTMYPTALATAMVLLASNTAAFPVHSPNPEFNLSIRANSQTISCAGSSACNIALSSTLSWACNRAHTRIDPLATYKTGYVLDRIQWQDANMIAGVERVTQESVLTCMHLPLAVGYLCLVHVGVRAPVPR